MKNIIILFGEMGGGKNYWGERLAKEHGYVFFDGDTVATPEMVSRVSKFKPLNKDIIKDYVNVLIGSITARAQNATGLVVAQALYSNKDRDFIRWFLNALGFNVKFIWVKSPFVKNMKQIYSRPKGLRWVLYWLMNKPFFEIPKHDHEVI